MVRTRNFSTCTDTSSLKKVTNHNGHLPLSKIIGTSGEGRIPRIKGRKNMNVHQRIALFEVDPWAKNATEEAVDCVGCGKRLRLDKRMSFNYEPFKKHKRRCRHIVLTEGNRKRSRIDHENMSLASLSNVVNPRLKTQTLDTPRNEEGPFKNHQTYNTQCHEPASICAPQIWSNAALEAAESLLSLSRNT